MPMTAPEVPADWPVQPIDPNDPPPFSRPMICGTCGLAWDDDAVTSMTPAPSARCPFEPFHADEPEPDATPASVLATLERKHKEAVDYFETYDRPSSEIEGGWLDDDGSWSSWEAEAEGGRAEATRDAFAEALEIVRPFVSDLTRACEALSLARTAITDPNALHDPPRWDGGLSYSSNAMRQDDLDTYAANRIDEAMSILNPQED
jgi:hypothetical protein